MPDEIPDPQRRTGFCLSSVLRIGSAEERLLCCCCCLVMRVSVDGINILYLLALFLYVMFSGVVNANCKKCRSSRIYGLMLRRMHATGALNRIIIVYGIIYIQSRISIYMNKTFLCLVKNSDDAKNAIPLRCNQAILT